MDLHGARTVEDVDRDLSLLADPSGPTLTGVMEALKQLSTMTPILNAVNSDLQKIEMTLSKAEKLSRSEFSQRVKILDAELIKLDALMLADYSNEVRHELSQDCMSLRVKLGMRVCCPA